MPAYDAVAEAESLELVRKVLSELVTCLEALRGTSWQDPAERYRWLNAKHVRIALDGYLHLRQSGGIDASRLIIRTAVEAFLRLRSVQFHPEVLYRITYGEHLDQVAWVNATSGNPQSAAVQAQVDRLEQDYQSAMQSMSAVIPQPPDAAKRIRIEQLARLANIPGFYDFNYRLYCRYTHANVAALLGDLDDTSPLDNRTMALCGLGAIDTLPTKNVPRLEALAEFFKSH